MSGIAAPVMEWRRLDQEEVELLLRLSVPMERDLEAMRSSTGCGSLTLEDSISPMRAYPIALYDDTAEENDLAYKTEAINLPRAQCTKPTGVMTQLAFK